MISRYLYRTKKTSEPILMKALRNTAVIVGIGIFSVVVIRMYAFPASVIPLDFVIIWVIFLVGGGITLYYDDKRRKRRKELLRTEESNAGRDRP